MLIAGGGPELCSFAAERLVFSVNGSHRVSSGNTLEKQVFAINIATVQEHYMGVIADEL